MSRRALGGDAAVLASAVAFGITIPLSKWVLDDTAAPYWLVAVRFLVGGLLLLPVALRRPASGNGSAEISAKAFPDSEGRAVAMCTVPLLLGYLALTVGLERTSSTTAAFLSYLLVVIVPVLSALVLRTLPSRAVAIGIVLSVAGLERLTGGGENDFGSGEALCLLAAFLFAIHVLVLGHVVTTTDVDSTRLASFQLIGVGVLAVPVALAADAVPQSGDWWAGALAAAAIGVAALLLQTVGQREVGPSRTALILMVDPVVAAIGGYALLDERIGWRGVLGAALILAGIAIAEVMTLDPVVNQRER